MRIAVSTSVMFSLGGTTWNQMASTANSNFYYVYKIILTNSTTMYVATSVGIFQTVDTGVTFQQLSIAGSQVECWMDMAMFLSGENTYTIYAWQRYDFYRKLVKCLHKLKLILFGRQDICTRIANNI